MSGIPPAGLVALTVARTDPHPFEEWCYCARCREWAALVGLVCLAGSVLLVVAALVFYP